MRIGVTVDNPDSVVDDARWAETAGFDLIGCGEHLFFHGPTPHSFTMLAAAAAATERIGLVSSIALLPLYAPAMVAKMATTIDRISKGRFELGLGSGGEYPKEFAAAGVDPATRFARTDEGLEVLRRVFTGERTSYDGAFSTLDDVKLDPPPWRPAGPPVWLGGRGPIALRRAGRFADAWMPYMVDPGQVSAGLDAVRSAAVDSGRHREDVSGALFVWTAVDDDAEWARSVGIDTVSTAYRQDFSRMADRYLLLGDPESVIRRLDEFRDAGVESILVQPAATNAADRERILRCLSEQVLPRIAAAGGSSDAD